MIIQVLYNIASAWFAFLLPSYATFKALSRRPLSETDLQRWSMYWIVIGIFLAFERLAESLVTWLPFYWEIKIIFLLYLSSSQSEGSTYIYTAYIEPLFIGYEPDLDAGFFAILHKIVASLEPHFIALRESARSSFSNAPSGWSIASYIPTFSLPSLPETTFWTTYNPFATREHHGAIRGSSNVRIQSPSFSAPNKPPSED